MDELFFCEQALVVEVLTVAHRSCRLGVNMLMTEQMNQYQVAVGVLSSLRLRQKMVNLKFFFVEERSPHSGQRPCCLLASFWLECVRSLAFAACRFAQ
jgi:hypothetical protein